MLRGLLASSLLMLLAACMHSVEYITTTDGHPLSRDAAEKDLIEHGLSFQLKEPLDTPLSLISARLPDYPLTLMRGNVAGVVTVVFHVGSDGSVSSIQVKGNPNPVLAALTVGAISGWRFKPPVRNGKPTDLWLDFQYEFRLQD
jgi:TonB family protein